MENKPFGFEKKKENEFEIYRKRNARVCTANNSRLGRVKDFKDGFLYLLPVLVQESTYDNEGKEKSFMRIETEIPTKIKLINIEIIEPISEGHMEKLVKNFNQKEPLIIIPQVYTPKKQLLIKPTN